MESARNKSEKRFYYFIVDMRLGLCFCIYFLILAGWALAAPGGLTPVDYYIQKGDEQSAARQYAEAVKTYGQAVDAWTSDMGFKKRALANFKRGLARALAGDLKPALEDLNVAVELDPKNPEMLVARGVVQFRRRATDKALKDAGRALTLDRRLVAANVLRACALDRSKNPRGAARAATAALKVAPQNVEALIARGIALLHSGALGKAMVDLDRAVELAPKNARAYYWRAATYKKRKMKDSRKLDEGYVKRLRPDLEEQVKKRGSPYLYPLPFGD